MSFSAKILLFDEDLRSLSLLNDGLNSRGIEPEIRQVRTLPDFINSLDDFKPEAVLINYRQSSYESLTALALTRKKNPTYPFIFIFADEPISYLVQNRISPMLSNKEIGLLSDSIRQIFEQLKELSIVKEKQLLADTEFSIEKEKEEKARRVLKNSPGLILLYDNEGNYIEHYLSAASPNNYPSEKFFEKNLNDLLTDGDIVKIKDHTATEFELYEFTVRTANQTKIYFLQVMTANDAQLILYVNDITKEKELSEELNRLKSVIHASDGMQFLLDESWQIILTTQGVESFFGGEEFLQSRCLDDILPDMVPGLTMQQIAIGLELENSWSNIFQYKNDNKLDKMALVSANKVEHGGAVTGIIISITDLSEFKERENEFRLEAEKYRTITENLNLGIVGLREQNIYFANDIFCNLLGLKQTAIVGTDFKELLVKEDKKVFDEIVRRLLAEESADSSTELRLLHKNDITIVNAEISLKLAKFDGAFTIFCIIKDASEAKLQQMLVENQRSNSTLISANMLIPKDHDLRTSLNGILGFADIIKEHFKDKSEEEFLNFADQILRSGKELVDILDLYPHLDSSEGNVVTLEINSISLSDILTKTLESVKGQNGKKEIRLNFLYSSKIEVLADEKRLSQLLLSIMKNSYDSHSESTIHVETGFDGQKAKAYIRLKDSGIKLEEKQLPLLFKPMALDTSKKYPELYKLGLILYPAQRIVQQMNGDLMVSNSNETGLCVTIFLPVPERKDSSKGNLGNTLIAVSTELVMLTELNPVILIVEDDPGCAKMLQITFRNLTKTDIACNGDEALDFIAGRSATGQTYDLLLLDIGLPPPWDGIMLRKEILRRFPQYENVPILAETAYAMKNDVSRITSAGFDAYIAKPIDRRYMIKTMVAALKKYNRL